MLPNDLVSDYYQKHHLGAHGCARYGFTIAPTARAAWFMPRLGRGKRVLDVGCRDGTMTSRLADGNEMVGVDVDPAALARATEAHGFETHQVNLNQEGLPFPAESFDAVIAGEVLEHLQFPEVVVEELRRVLKPDGLFMGTVPNAFRLYNRLRFLTGRDFEDDPTHLHHFSPSSLRALLLPFRDVEIEFLSSRYLRISPRLMGTNMAWCCRK
jgi:ubiquinone/menaquinone biosynthesis C-methylase UbiE